jgi:hypothetical protein
MLKTCFRFETTNLNLNISAWSNSKYEFESLNVCYKKHLVEIILKHSFLDAVSCFEEKYWTSLLKLKNGWKSWS